MHRPHKHTSVTGVVSFHETREEVTRLIKLELLILGIGFTLVGVVGAVCFLYLLLVH